MPTEPASHADTIPGLAAAAARRWPNRPAIVDGDKTLTFSELDEERRRAGRALIALGIERGDRVGIWAPNIWEWIVAALAVQSAGAIVVPVNTRMKGQEAADILSDAGARALFVIGDFLGAHYPDLISAVWPKPLEQMIVLRDARAGETDWESFLALADEVSEVELTARMPDADDISDILFTSGTTGRAKGVMTAHGQNLRAFDAWANAVGLVEGDRYLVVSPFFHSFGYKAGWVAALMRGATVYPVQAFDAELALAQIERDRITVMPGAPTLYHSLLAHPRLKDFDISSLRAAITGSATIPPILIERMRSELGFDVVLSGYGLTESCGVVSLSVASDDPETVATACGRAIEGIELRCVDEKGNPVPTGTPGEVVLRGYNVMRGYFNNPEATRDTVDADGWLHTGDIGLLDQRGYLRITDRMKDMFIVGGFNCYPAEVERLLSAHPAVGQVAVIGVPDDRLGEVGKAFVVPKPGAAINGAEIIAWAREHMANYKVPRFVDIVAALPTNASGKVVKPELRKMSVPAT